MGKQDPPVVMAGGCRKETLVGYTQHSPGAQSVTSIEKAGALPLKASMEAQGVGAPTHPKLPAGSEATPQVPGVPQNCELSQVPWMMRVVVVPAKVTESVAPF